MNINTKKAKGNALLLLTAFIWGIAFVAQSAGMDYVGPFAFLFARSVLGGLVLIPCIFLMDHLTPEAERLLTAYRTLETEVNASRQERVHALFDSL